MTKQQNDFSNLASLCKALSQTSTFNVAENKNPENKNPQKSEVKESLSNLMPLQEAIENGDFVSVFHYLSVTPDLVNQELPNGLGVFEYSLKSGHTALADKLITLEKFDPNLKNHNPFLSCLSIGYFDLASRLIDNGLNPNLRINDSLSFLLLCLDKDLYVLAQKLIDKGASVDYRDNQGWTALIYASVRGERAKVEFLLKNKASVDICTNDGWTAVVGAYAKGHTEIAETLLSAGATYGKKYAQAALIKAFKDRNLRLIDQLLKLDVDCDIKLNDSETLLTRAIVEREWKLVEEFLKHGANPFDQCKGGIPIIHKLVEAGKTGLVALIISKGVSVNACANKQSPLQIAVNKHLTVLATFLAKQGADLEVCDSAGRTPLNIAIYNSNYALATMLLQEGANPFIKDNFGRSAWDNCSSNQTDVINLMRKFNG